MRRIAILDDRAPQRETLRTLIDTVLPKGWECIACPLLKSVNEYPNWLIDKDVQVLLADQVLNEQAAEVGSQAVDYKAHEVIEEIRRTLPNFPVYIITSFPDDADLLRHSGDADDVLTRRELSRKPKVFVARMVRAGTKFAEDHQKDLDTLGELSKKVAAGTDTATDRKKLRALQTFIGLGVERPSDKTRAELLRSLETKLDELDAVRGKIEKFLEKKPRK
jgi:DNA-binding NarL/FixJ family response regulator